LRLPRPALPQIRATPARQRTRSRHESQSSHHGRLYQRVRKKIGGIMPGLKRGGTNRRRLSHEGRSPCAREPPLLTDRKRNSERNSDLWVKNFAGNQAANAIPCRTVWSSAASHVTQKHVQPVFLQLLSPALTAARPRRPSLDDLQGDFPLERTLTVHVQLSDRSLRHRDSAPATCPGRPFVGRLATHPRDHHHRYDVAEPHARTVADSLAGLGPRGCGAVEAGKRANPWRAPIVYGTACCSTRPTAVGCRRVGAA